MTKGAFFHHFPSKDALAVAAAEHWGSTTGALFAAADYQHHDDPYDRVMGYLDLREALVDGEAAEYTCLVGTMVQEAFATTPTCGPPARPPCSVTSPTSSRTSPRSSRSAALRPA